MDVSDIKSLVSTVEEKLKAEPALLEKFKSDPAGAVKSVVGVDIPDDAVKKIADAVKTKVAVDDVSGAVDKLKGLFSK